MSLDERSISQLRARECVCLMEIEFQESVIRNARKRLVFWKEQCRLVREQLNGQTELIPEVVK